MANVREQIHALLQPLVPERKFNGAALVSQRGSILYSDAWGQANMELATDNTTNTKFRIGSITKTFTGVSILQLAEKGLLRLDDPVSRFFPQQMSGNAITIHHLLTHTSGIPNYTDDPSMFDWAANPSTPEVLIGRFAHKEPEFAPGEQYKYSNSGYILLGAILEQITGQSYADYLQEHIFRPLGMNHTQVDQPSHILLNRAAGYHQDEEGHFSNAPAFDPSNAYAAGAIISTIEDMHLWDQALYTEQLLTKPSLDLMFTPVKGERDFQYGCGWIIQDTPFGKLVCHSGGIPGFSSVLLRFIEQQTAVIVLSNILQDVSAIGKQLAELAMQPANSIS
ncbi:serine hydrolase domain-containing protein [Paenibacillus sp. JDR-2]|uniref:serine hydrolase domain-containing protein n=1 Tax=Paenibacillus sp. (strain JDR-2) TaxID=324057 RepID=UPI00030CB4AF|nr:serine hydrolase domain-containing protein [Paenibacillus sp. JDR-2]